MIQGDYGDYIHSWEDYLSSGRYEMDRKYWEVTYHARPEKLLILFGWLLFGCFAGAVCCLLGIIRYIQIKREGY